MLEPEGTEVLISRPARANVIKLFAHVIYSQTKQVRVFVPSKPFQPSPTFGSKARAYQRGAPFRCFPRGLAPCLTLGWKSLLGTNALAYFVFLSVTKKERFIALRFEVNVIKPFLSSLTEWPNKLEHLNLASPALKLLYH
jgi:hypothetical protein